MNVKKPKTSNSPNYLPPGEPTCGEKTPFKPHWGCSREAGHSGDHAAHHDLAGLVSEDYDRDHPVMVARWGSD